MCRNYALIAALAALCAAAMPAGAEQRTWQGAADNDWFNPDNWSPLGAPANEDDLTITSGSPVAAERVEVEDGSITAIGPMAAPSLGALWAGLYGRADLAVRDGAQLSDAWGALARYGGSSATAAVLGEGSRWTTTGDLCIGWEGAAELDVLGGGEVSAQFATLGMATGGRGAATVEGAGSFLHAAAGLTVGQLGDAAMRVRDGATVGDLYGLIGNGAGSRADVTVEGAGSRWDNDAFLYVGGAGRGELTVSQGGVVTSDLGVVGHSSGGSGFALVTGAGSRWENSGTLYVGGADAGYAGHGDLTISEGAAVTSSQGIIGGSYGSTGTVNLIDGESSWDHGEELIVGAAGRGELNLTGGASLTSVTATIGQAAGAFGRAVLDGGSWTVTRDYSDSETAPLAVGSQGHGVLEVRDGTVSCSYLALGAQAGGHGELILDGPDARLEQSHSWLHVGGSMYDPVGGHGSLTLRNGAVLSNTYYGSIGVAAGSDGEVVVEGEGSRWMVGAVYLGGNTRYSSGPGTGTLTVRDGGMLHGVEYPAFINLGYKPGARGTLVIEDAESGCFARVCVGKQGEGRLEVRDGAQLVGTGYGILEVADASGSFGAVLIENPGTRVMAMGLRDSALDETYTAVGRAGDAEVIIRDGAMLESPSVSNWHMACEPGSSAVMTVQDPGTRWEAWDVVVGDGGQAELNILNGATASTGIVDIARRAGSTGSVSVSGEGTTWQTYSIAIGGNGSNNTAGGQAAMSVTAGARVRASDRLRVFEGGELRLDDGSMTVKADIDQAAPNQLLNTATVYSAGLIAADVRNEWGFTATGRNSRIDGSFTQCESGWLYLTLSDPLADSFTRLDVSGPANLDGVLSLVGDGSYAPWLGDTFEIITASDVSGEFADVALPDPWVGFEIIYGEQSVTARVNRVSPLLTREWGDFNGDGAISGADYVVWSDSFGDTGEGLAADANGDGQVSGVDYVTWAANFGSAVPAPVSVPEPGYLALLLMGVAGALTRRRA